MVISKKILIPKIIARKLEKLGMFLRLYLQLVVRYRHINA